MNNKNNKRFKGAIFDIDGTLMDSMDMWEQVGSFFLKSMNIEPALDLNHALSELSLEAGADYLIRSYHLKMTRQQVLEQIDRITADFYETKVQLKDGAQEFLEKLSRQKIQMTAATMSVRKNVEAALKRLDVLKYFSGIYDCSEYHTDKHSPDIYYIASEAFHAQPEEICVFEDSLAAIKTAKKAGFLTAAVYDKSSANDAMELKEISDFYLESFRKFMQNNCVDNISFFYK